MNVEKAEQKNYCWVGADLSVTTDANVYPFESLF
jgi:hypothetical protein